MSPELHDLLDRALPKEVGAPDFEALAHRGVRRRRVKRGTAAVAVLAVVVGVGAALQLPEGDRLPVINPGPDSAPMWEQVDQGPLTPRIDPVVAVDGSRVVVWGGRGDPPAGRAIAPNGDEHAEVDLQDGAVWDATTRTWADAVRPPLSARAEPAVRLVGDTLLVWGGSERVPSGGGGLWLGGPSRHLTDGAVYDLLSGRWQLVPPAPLVARSGGLLHWNGDELLVWGGRDDADRPLSDGARWTREGGWNVMEPAPLEPRGGPLVAVDDTYLMVWGGFVDDGGRGERVLSDGAAYHRDRGTWTDLPASPLSDRWFSEEWLGGEGNAFLDDEGVVLVSGGTSRWALRTGRALDAARLDLSSMTWELLPNAPDAARYAEPHSTGLRAVDDGRQGRVWTYDQVNAEWVEVRPLPRHLHGMQLQVLDAGPSPVVAHTEVDSRDDPLSWHPVTVIINGAAHAPPVPEDWPIRQFAAVARVEGGVFIWGGQQADRQRWRAGHTSDGSPAVGGWFLSTR